MSLKRKAFWASVILIVGITVFLYINSKILKAEPYQLSVTFLSNNNRVAEKLGKPVRFSFNMFTGYGGQNTNVGKKAQFIIKIVGEQNRGIAEMELETQKSKWLVTRATLITENGERINLLDSSKAL
jgi:hypothetical protein